MGDTPTLHGMIAELQTRMAVVDMTTESRNSDVVSIILEHPHWLETIAEQIDAMEEHDPELLSPCERQKFELMVALLDQPL